MKRVIVYCLLAATMAACSGTKSASGKQVTFEQLKQSDFGGREEKSIAMITTTEDLAKLYSEMGWDAIPKVDFEKNNVVAIFMGQKNSGGFSISIESVTMEDGTLNIKTKETRPDGMATAVMTAPYTIAVVPKTTKFVVN